MFHCVVILHGMLEHGVHCCHEHAGHRPRLHRRAGHLAVFAYKEMWRIQAGPESLHL